MKNKKYPVRMTIYITQEMYDKLKEKRFKSNMKYTELIRQAIIAYLG